MTRNNGSRGSGSVGSLMYRTKGNSGSDERSHRRLTYH